MPKWPAVMVNYGSGHSKYRIYGFLLVHIFAGVGIIQVRYCEVVDVRLRLIINFNNSKIIFENFRLSLSQKCFPVRKEGAITSLTNTV